MNFLGELKLTFSQNMKSITDISVIDDKVLDIVVEPDASNSDQDPASFLFNWSVTQFTARSLQIQIEWTNIYRISAGSNRDTLKV